MIQRSPENWNVQENPPLPPPNPDDLLLDLTGMVPISELMWDAGELRMVVRPLTEGDPTPVVGGTLESVVNQFATIQHLPPLAIIKRSNLQEARAGCSVGVDGGGNEVVVVPWNGPRSQGTRTSSDTLMQAVAVDGMVPCNKKAKADEGPKGSYVPSYGTCSASATHAGSCSAVADACFPRASGASMSDTGSLQMISGGFTFTTNSLGNTSSAANQTTKGGEEHDSASHSINEMDAEEEKKKAKGKAPQVSTKKNRAASVHNQSERKRRDKINEKMRTLQKMVPNASKTDKASMLDEVIDYLKQLKAQISLMTRMPAILMQQQLQLMSMMGMGINMGMGMGSGGPVPVPHPNFFISNALEAFAAGGEPPQPQAVPVAEPFSVFVARQQNEAATTDAWARVAELYQQYQQGHGA